MNNTEKLKQRICDIINVRIPKQKPDVNLLEKRMWIRVLLGAILLLSVLLCLLLFAQAADLFFCTELEPFCYYTLRDKCFHFIYPLSTFLLLVLPCAIFFWAIDELPNPIISLFFPGVLLCFISICFPVRSFIIFWAAVLTICDIETVFQRRITPFGTAIQKYCWITQNLFFSDKSIQPDNIHTRKTLAFKYAVLNLMLAAIFAYICFAKTFPTAAYSNDTGEIGYFKLAAIISIILLISAVTTSILRVKITTRTFRKSDFYIGKLKTLLFIIIIFTVPVIDRKIEHCSNCINERYHAPIP